MRSSMKRLRHLSTVALVSFNRCAIELLSSPSALLKTMRALSLSPDGSERLRANDCSCDRSSSVNTSSVFGLPSCGRVAAAHPADATALPARRPQRADLLRRGDGLLSAERVSAQGLLSLAAQRARQASAARTPSAPSKPRPPPPSTTRCRRASATRSARRPSTWPSSRNASSAPES